MSSPFDSMFAKPTNTATPTAAAVSNIDVAQSVGQLTTTNANVPAKPVNPVWVEKARQAVTSNQVISYGADCSQKLAKVSENMMADTKIEQFGNFGNGIIELLKITDSIKISDFQVGPEKKSFFGTIQKLFTSARVDITAKVESTTKTIQRLEDNLKKEVDIARQCIKEGDQLFELTLQQYQDLEQAIDGLEYVYNNEMIPEFNTRQAEITAQGVNADPIIVQRLNDFQAECVRTDKQIDRLKRVRMLAQLNLPDIRIMQQTAQSNVDQFQDAIINLIPLWYTNMNKARQASILLRQATVNSTMHDRTQEMLRMGAELSNKAAVLTAENANKPNVTIETLEYVQNQLIDALKQRKDIEAKGAASRAEGARKMIEMTNGLKKELATW